MLRYQVALLRARILQIYFNLKSFDELPFQLINGDFEDRRIVVPRPPRPKHRK